MPDKRNTTQTLLIAIASLLVSFLFQDSAKAQITFTDDNVHIIDTLRVFNYNIRHGRGWDNDVVDMERIANVIKLRNPDIVTLQEVDVNVTRSGNIDQMQILGELLDMEPVFYKLIPHQGGEFGNGTLTNLEIITTDNLMFTRGGEGVQRGLIQVVVNIGGQPVVVMNTHLCNESEYNRLLSVNQMIEIKEEYDGMPIVLAGDMNALPNSDPISNLNEHYSDTWLEKGVGFGYTVRPGNPTRRIDYIFYSNNMSGDGGVYLRPIKIEVVMNNPLTYASDHLPVYGEFEIVQAKTTSAKTQDDLPKSFQLDQNYPNPFNPASVITYSVPQTSHVKLDVYSVTGQHITTLVNEMKSTGEYQVYFDGATLSSGIYLYTFRADNFIQTKKMMLIK